MKQFAYLGVLAVCLLGTGLLEIFLRARVYRRWLRLILTLIPVVLIFTLWDVYAISRHHWTFDANFVTGIIAVANVPLEEVCFFIAIPICSILTLEAVRSMRSWAVGDELTSDTGDEQ
ncbi:MAG: lycopene cyclase domain-containing protein [Actinobacteria bacterium]|nr:lycopene cyclase domain-containing protein [Actinomycetota bacterium]